MGGMDEWRTRLAAELLDENAENAGERAGRSVFAPSRSTAMEIAFGRARSELTYVLALGRARAQSSAPSAPITGDVAGDAIWLRVGEARLAFTFDRDAGEIAMSAPGRDAKLAVREDGTLAANGEPCEIDALVRDAIDATVRAWKMAGAKKE